METATGHFQGRIGTSTLKAVSFLAMVFVFFPGQHIAAAEGRWFVGGYGGQSTFAKETDVFTLKADYVNSYLTALIIGKEFGNYFKDRIRVEAEGQIVKHWNLQDHFEFNAVFVLRWLSFFWDRYLDTSLAIGNGISYATKIPEIEAQKHEETSKILYYLMIEMDFVVPCRSDWSIITRFHHRSGIFGLINDVSGGSNAVGLGLKYTF